MFAMSVHSPRNPVDPPDVDPDDREAIHRIQAHLRELRQHGEDHALNREEWDRFYRSHMRDLSRLAQGYHWLQDELDDSVQDLWLMIISRLPDLRFDPGRGDLRDWIAVAARHRLVDRERCRRSHPVGHLGVEAIEQIVGREPNPATAFERNRMRDLVRHALDELSLLVSPRDYEAFVLHSLQELSVREVARRLGMTESQVWSSHHRTSRKLRPLLARRLDPESSEPPSSPEQSGIPTARPSRRPGKAPGRRADWGMARGRPIRRILVTGGCGFIGANFVRHLLETDPTIEVTNVDALTYAGNPDNLADLGEHPRYRFVRGDITDRPMISELVTRGEFHAIVNLAAESHVDRSIDDATPFLHTNVVGTQCLLDAARAAKVPRYVQVSTDEVYGTLQSDDRPFRETSPLAPRSPYAASKAAADLLVRAAHHTFGLDAVITRSSNNYGPYQFPEKLIPLFITNALAGIPVPVYGDGRQVRDWIHVRDHCRGIEAALRLGQAGEVYNFGGKSERSNIDVARAILELCGQTAGLIRYVTDRPGHDRRYAIDYSKAEAELGWRPTVAFEDGLAATVAWHRGNTVCLHRILSRISRDETPSRD
jgi:dTDP-glucose 4,6-dehydratase